MATVIPSSHAHTTRESQAGNFEGRKRKTTFGIHLAVSRSTFVKALIEFARVVAIFNLNPRTLTVEEFQKLKTPSMKMTSGTGKTLLYHERVHLFGKLSIAFFFSGKKGQLTSAASTWKRRLPERNPAIP